MLVFKLKTDLFEFLTSENKEEEIVHILTLKNKDVFEERIYGETLAKITHFYATLERSFIIESFFINGKFLKVIPLG